MIKNLLEYIIFQVKCMGKGSKLNSLWIEDHSPLLASLKGSMTKNRCFEGLTIGVCLPGTWESYMFLSTITAGGARVWYYPMFCKPEVGVQLMKENTIKLVRSKNLVEHIRKSDFLYDSTAFFGKALIQNDISVKGIIEQTASGIKFYSKYYEKSLIKQPVLNIDGAFVKRIGENKRAAALGLIEALLKLHLFLPSKRVLILGYGSVGEGCAFYLSKLGCKIGVYDINKSKQIEAERCGYKTGQLEQLLSEADIIINATGSFTPVLDKEKLKMLKCKAILVNMGGIGWDQRFFDDKQKQKSGDWITKICLNNYKYIYEIAQGFPINLILASGTDTETMDVVFSLGILALQYLVKNYSSLPKNIQLIPKEIQLKHLEQVARLSERKDLVALWKDEYESSTN